MGDDLQFSAGKPAHSATVGPFVLDRYEVTLGRMRQFVAFLEQQGSWHPSVGQGKNPNVAEDQGWQAAWNEKAHSTKEDVVALLKAPSCFEGAISGDATVIWRDTPGSESEESKPINCADWWLAYAFCVWDGGCLATEAEWEFAAAGGEEDRIFPWGNELPDTSYASYYCFAAKKEAECTIDDVRPVGSYPKGAGRWGHMDLGGNMGEWVRDQPRNGWYNGPPGNPCINCASLLDPTSEISISGVRGGNFMDNPLSMIAAHPDDYATNQGILYLGIRCARNP